METSGILQVKNRTLIGGSTAKRLRRSGFLPASICSKEVGSVAVELRKDTLMRELSKSGRATVFTLEADDGKSYNAMLKDIHVAPVTGEYLNVIFQQVSLSEETKADIPLRFEGRDNLDMRRLTMLQQVDTVTVRALPTEIPNGIDIDLTALQAGDKIHVKDLVVPEGVTIEADPEQLVISITDPRVQIVEEEDAEATGEETTEPGSTEE